MSKRKRLSRPANRGTGNPGTPELRNRGTPPWLFPALLIATALAYSPAWFGGALWDDAAHLTRTDLQSVHGLWRIWFDIGATQQFYPVVHSMFWVLHQVWGDATLGYHLINIALHAGSAYLVARILTRLEIPGAALAAVIFALHPVMAESVAWITELKNTLSGICYLGSALVYLRFARERTWRPYALALGLFIVALLSKTVTATLPAALLVVFWWQNGRIDWRRDALPLAPFFVIGVVSGLTTAWVERTFIGASGVEFAFSFVERCLIAGRAFWFYVFKLAWPLNLVFVYPRWQVSQAVWWQYLFPAAALAAFAAAWALRRTSRAPLAALLFFAGTLFPALGFFNVYPFRYSFVADHFQYLASPGIIALASAGFTMWFARGARASSPPLATIVVIGVVLGGLTWREAHQYADVETLYRTTIDRNPGAWMAHANLGELKLRVAPQDLGEAIQHLQEALRLNPADAEAHNSLGVAWLRLDRPDDAIREHREALRLKPGLAEAQYNLGLVYQRLNDLEASRGAYEEAIRLNPYYVEARHNLANVLQGQGKFGEAVKPLEEAIALDPGLPDLRNNLGNVLLRLGRPSDAATQYRESLRLNPNSAEIHNNLGLALQQLGRLDEAIAEFEASLRLLPDSAMVRANLARAIALKGR